MGVSRRRDTVLELNFSELPLYRCRPVCGVSERGRTEYWEWRRKREGRREEGVGGGGGGTSTETIRLIRDGWVERGGRGGGGGEK